MGALASAIVCLCCPPVVSQSVSYRYDLRGRLIEAVNPDGSLTTYQYDASGNLLSVSYPPSLVGLSSITAPAGTLLALPIANLSQIRSVRFAPGIEATFTLDATGTLLLVTVPPGATAGALTITGAEGEISVTFAPLAAPLNLGCLAAAEDGSLRLLVPVAGGLLEYRALPGSTAGFTTTGALFAPGVLGVPCWIGTSEPTLGARSLVARAPVGGLVEYSRTSVRASWFQSTTFAPGALQEATAHGNASSGLSFGVTSQGSSFSYAEAAVAVVPEVGGLAYYVKDAGVWQRSGSTFASAVTGTPAFAIANGRSPYLFVPTGSGLVQYPTLATQPLVTFAAEAEPTARPAVVQAVRQDGSSLQLVVRLRDGALGYYRGFVASVGLNPPTVSWTGPIRFASAVRGDPALVAVQGQLEVAVLSQSGQIQRYVLTEGSLTWQRTY
jgi:YD repeat-containing protein